LQLPEPPTVSQQRKEGLEKKGKGRRGVLFKRPVQKNDEEKKERKKCGVIRATKFWNGNAKKWAGREWGLSKGQKKRIGE